MGSISLVLTEGFTAEADLAMQRGKELEGVSLSSTAHDERGTPSISHLLITQSLVMSGL